MTGLDPGINLDEPSPIADRGARTRRLDPMIATRAARGVADGFTEASLAFSDELAAASGCSDLLERSVAGMIRANGRFLEEMAGVFRRVADDVADRTVPADAPPISIDYELLADMVADRLAARTAAPVPPSPAKGGSVTS